ncbi:MAG: DUF21 domain-containing protein [Leptolyngbya sp. PLA1]|nr:DUF21 domain-containing protein [Leptolyngbya sp. PLA1]
MNPILEATLWALLFVGSIVMSAMISGTEMGCYSLNRVRLHVRANATPPDRLARMTMEEIARPVRLLITVLVSNNIVNYFGAMATAELFSRSGLGEAGVALVSTCVLAPLLFVLGEAVPKELFRLAADRLTPRMAPLLRGLRVLLQVTGVVALMSGVIALVEKVAGVRALEVTDPRQRMAQLLKEGHGEGVLSEAQVSLLDRAMLLRGITVGDEMVPWALVRAIPVEATRERAMKLIGQVPHARIAVVDRAGRVVGMLRQIDLHLRPEAAPADLLVQPARLTRDMRIRAALSAVVESAAKVGVVQDAAGRPVGLVTLKDLVEPLTGELADL